MGTCPGNWRHRMRKHKDTKTRRHQGRPHQRYLFAASLGAFVSLCHCVFLSNYLAAQQQPKQAVAVATTSNAQYRALLDQYCVGCHNQRSKTAGLMLDTMDLAEAGRHGDVWEKAIRKLRGGL